jgi:cob(I)alamin adenosyltransferase
VNLTCRNSPVNRGIEDFGARTATRRPVFRRSSTARRELSFGAFARGSIMPKLTRIYTRTGDAGDTALGSGRRVSKDHPRIEAYGTVDELNAAIGCALAAGLDPELDRALRPVQNDLFHLGSDLCYPEEDKESVKIPQIEQRHIDTLERHMDSMSDQLAPLENFILPGGTPGAAMLHLARTICRRAERVLVELRHREPIGGFTITYVNRLSDLLFVAARFENFKKGRPDVCWDSRA